MLQGLGFRDVLSAMNASFLMLTVCLFCIEQALLKFRKSVQGIYGEGFLSCPQAFCAAGMAVTGACWMVQVGGVGEPQTFKPESA